MTYFQQIIQDLMEYGLTQSDIANKFGSQQPIISRLYTGKQLEPGYSQGDRLVRLHVKEKRKARQRK